MAKTRKKRKQKIVYIPDEKAYAIYHIFSYCSRNGMVRISNNSAGLVNIERIVGNSPDIDAIKELCYSIYGNDKEEQN